MTKSFSDENTRRVSPYGSWASPITSELIAGKSVRLAEPGIVAGSLCWLEERPEEQGRTVLVRKANGGSAENITPAPFSVRARAHEYGGGAWTAADDTFFFVNDADQRIYHQTLDTSPQPLTAEDGRRYADLLVDRRRERLICVCEDHRAQSGEPTASLVAVYWDGSRVETLASGADFYSSPRLSADGRRLIWLTWDHPQMPWDGTTLWTAEVTDAGRLAALEKIAGGEKESIFQPEFSPAGDIIFASDKSGWWNLYRATRHETTRITREQAEFGRPQWAFGMSQYGFLDAERIVCAFTWDGFWRVALLHMRTGAMQAFDLPYTSIEQLIVADGEVLLLAGSGNQPLSLVRFQPASGDYQVVRKAFDTGLDPAWYSEPEAVTFQTSCNDIAHGLYYPPTNPDYQAPAAELPPLLVKCHGGPTAATSSILALKIQYWTSRGFAVLDVNYRGSSGYSRAYRDRLYGQWGVFDAEDCICGARYLAECGRVDSARLAISGSSAGGYTVLCALTFHDTFHAGASHYGIGELESAMTETHKFESRYGDKLVGPWPEARAIYRARSPLHHAEQLNCPVIFFQGLKDKVVPPNQAERMAEALRQKEVPVAHLTFAEEGHGFRRSETISRVLEAEFSFYATKFGFTPAEDPPASETRK